METDSKAHSVPTGIKVAAESGDKLQELNESAKGTDSDSRKAQEHILRRISRENNVRYKGTSLADSISSGVIQENDEKVKDPEAEKEKNFEACEDTTSDSGQASERILRRTSRQDNIRFETSSIDGISSRVIEESVKKATVLEVEDKDEKNKIDLFNVVHKLHGRISTIRTANKEHQSNEINSNPSQGFDVSKYVDDNWELDETKLGLFPDDDYALTYKDNPDTLPALFEEDSRFVFVDGLIQLAPEPTKPSFSIADLCSSMVLYN